MPFDAKGAGGFVTKKVGPLPLWGWVAGGAAAVFLFSRFRGASGGAGGGGGITIPTLRPGSESQLTDSSGVGSGAIGSPGQNAQGGMDTQPGGIMPWWWRGDPRPVLFDPTAGGTGQPGQPMPQSSATAGKAPPDLVGQTVGRLADLGTPGFKQTSPTRVTLPGSKPGVTYEYGPTTKLAGWIDPATGKFSKVPIPGGLPQYN